MQHRFCNISLNNVFIGEPSVNVTSGNRDMKTEKDVTVGTGKKMATKIVPQI